MSECLLCKDGWPIINSSVGPVHELPEPGGTFRCTAMQTITDDDVAFAEEVLAFTPGSFLGGSYVVKGREAKDIDVIIPHAEWPRTREHFHGRIQKVLKEIPTEREDIHDLDDERLVTVYRRGAVDLIVVADAYLGSYRAATDAMRADPVRYAERPARVAIHIFEADKVREKLGRPLEAELRANRRTLSPVGGGHGGGSSGDYPHREPDE